MSGSQSLSRRNSAPRPKATKRPRLPSNAQITKRPLLRPALPNPSLSAKSQPHLLYLSSHTSFIATIKRIRNLLAKTEGRRMQSLLSRKRHDSNPLSSAKVERAVGKELRDEQASGSKKRKRGACEGAEGEGEKEKDVIYVKASGKAIERLVSVVGYLLRQGDVDVKLETGTTGAIDDVEAPEKEEHNMAEAMDVDTAKEKKEEVADEVPESRIRQISFLQARITQR